MLVDEKEILHQHAVTCFLVRFADRSHSFKDFKVSIFKRSDRHGRDHRGLWGAVSSRILDTDLGPLAAAHRGVRDKTGLGHEDISLLREGKTHVVRSHDRSRRWTIHPFAFVLDPGAKPIRLSSHHTDFRFVHPQSVETFASVPELDVTLWRTLVGAETAKGFKALTDDKDSGARTLATKAVQVLLTASSSSDFDWSTNVTSYWRSLRLVAWHLANNRPAMGPAIERACLRVVSLATPQMKQAKTVAEAREIVEAACMQTLTERASGRGLVAKEFVSYLSKANATKASTLLSSDDEITFLTLSRSCAKICILEYVRLIHDKRLHVIVLESRPCFEGVSMALDVDRRIREELAFQDEGCRDRVRVTLAADAAVGTFAHSVDYVLLGCDRINEFGDISNKVGSVTAVLTARELSQKKCSVIALAETEKISRRRDQKLHVDEQHARTDLTSAWQVDEKSSSILKSGSGVEIATPLFEWLPSRYIDIYITEKGPLHHDGVALHSARAMQEWDEVFSGL